MKTIPNEEAIEAPRRPKSRTVAQRLQYLSQWEASALTAEAFAKLHPINAESLYRWRMKKKSGKLRVRQSAEQTFRELKIATTPSPPPSRSPTITLKSPALEISLAGIELDERLRSFLGTLSQEVLGV